MTTTLAAPAIHCVFGAWLRIAAASALSFMNVEIEKWLPRSKPIPSDATERE